MSIDEIVKVFAGPIALLIVAFFVTGRFSRIQMEIARSQRDIAFDKLKLDIFEQRYEIYSAAKSLIECVPGTFDYDKIDLMRIR